MCCVRAQGAHKDAAVLEEAEATLLLSHAHKRARRALNSLSGEHMPTSSAAAATDDDRESAPFPPSAEVSSTSSSTHSSAAAAADTSSGLNLPYVADSNSVSSPNTSAGSSGSLPIISKGYGVDAATTITVSCNGEDPTSVPYISSSGREGNSSAGLSSSSSSSSSGGGVQDSASSTQPVFDLEASLSGRPASESVLLRRAMEEWWAYQFPNQQNRLVSWCGGNVGLAEAQVLRRHRECVQPKKASCPPIHWRMLLG